MKSLLFRPPYAEDIEPETIDQVLPLKKVSEMGYYTVGISIDPNDWRAPGVDQIVQNTLARARENKGGVVLLHDSGGDRSQTVEALPKLIKALQDGGFKIVPLSELIGVEAAVLNPVANERDAVTAIADTFYFNIVGVLSGVVGFLFFFSLWFGIIRLFLLLLLAVIGKIQSAKRVFDKNFRPRVTIIILAFNEGKVIKAVLEENARVEYENLEILVVDDGSEDDTLKVLRDNFSHHPLIKILTKPNEGKSKAINFALAKASGEIVVLIDADTFIDRKAVGYLVRHFDDAKVAAVAGNAKVGNRLNLITNFQALEYVTNQNLERRALNLLNTITVVPGAIGPWRLEVLEEMGGFNDHTLAEDNDMTVEVLKAGYRVENEENAYAYTEAPTNIMVLAKQRFRWTFGTLQVFWKNRKSLFRPKYRGLAFVGLPNTFFFQIFSPVVLPLIDLGVLAGIVFAFWKTYQHVDIDAVYQIGQYLFYYALFTFLDVFTVIVAFLLERKRDWRLLLFLLPQRIFYRFFMNYICLKSLYSALRGSTVNWNKIERKGNVKSGGN